ncbi:MAG: hypothetical protein H7343_04060 [Undibacterium sp.]|nr:hypothetical protein [Opitutaceae bacterium]
MSTSAVESWLREHTGLDASTLGLGAVERAVRARLAALGGESPARYVERLANSAEERLQLIERVIVPETWFFRDRAALEAVARHTAETWGPAHATETFRVLCVPCSTGEEPYSLAMAFSRAGWPLERLSIEALDISRENITRAREGVYRKNSFRGADLLFRDLFLEPAGRDAWRVSERVRAPVAFAEGNLVAAGFATGRAFYDAIFCRNLLIYFDRPTQARAITALGTLLAADGFFAVGPAEPVLLFEHGFSTVNIPGAFLLRRTPPRAPAPLPAPATRVVTKPKHELPPTPPRPHPPRAVVPARLAPTGPDTLTTIQALADAGQLGDAARRGTALLASGATSELLYLLGAIADATGDGTKAEAYYRKALYLDPQHAAALAQLALHAEKQGDLRSARALRARAQRTLTTETA